MLEPLSALVCCRKRLNGRVRVEIGRIVESKRFDLSVT